MLLTSRWSNLMSALAPLTSGLLAGFCLCLCHLLSLHSAPLSRRVSHEFAFSLTLVSSSRNSWRFGVHISACPSISAGCSFSSYFSVDYFNRDLKGEELDSCSDTTDITQKSWVSFLKTEEHQKEVRREERGELHLWDSPS